jgi:hypothetical protein
MDGDQISDKFSLNYAGKASLFEGKTKLPSGLSEARLQVLAADRAGNFGQHVIPYRLVP